MASNNYTSANIVPSADTFREWVDLTNRITYDMEKYVVSTTLTAVGACTTGNSFVNGHFSASTLRVKDLILGAAADDPVSNQVGTNAAFANITFGTNTTFIANDTHDSIVNAQSNVYIVNVGTTFVANTDGGFVTLNAIVNTFTSNAQNIDFNALSFDVQGGELTISSNVTVNSTANAVVIDAPNLVFSGNSTVGNVDVDAKLTHISSANTTIDAGELNITSNVNIDAASVDIQDGELTISSNVTVNSTANAVVIDAPNFVFSGNSTVGNVDIDSNLTTITSANTFIENGELNVDSNTVFTANVNITADSDDFNIGSDVVTINTSTTTFQSNAGTNVFNTKIDANANVDIDNDLTTITSANTVVENGEFNITSNVNFDAASFDIAGGSLNVSSNVTINSTANTFTSNAALNVFNTPVDVNANVDIDNDLTTITSANTVVENGEFNITSNVNFDAASFDILAGTFNVTQSNSTTHSINIDETANTFTSNAGLNVFNTPLDINANIDVDNTTTDFNSTNFIVTGTTANVTSTTMNIHGTSLDVNSNTNIDGIITTTANATIGSANDDLLTVNSNTVLNDKLNVKKAVDFDSTLNVDGDVTLQANTTVGSNTLDGVAINARVTTGILPYGNSTNSNTNLLGNSTARWVISANTLNASGDITGGADLDITSEANTNTLRVRTTSELTGAVNANTSVTTGNVVITRTQIAVGNSSANVVISQNGDISTDGKIDVDANTDANSTAASIVTEGGLLVKKKSYLTGEVSAAANVTVDGTAYFKGNVDLGDANTDTVTFTSKVDSGIVPYGNSTNSNTNVLGATDARWVIYANTLGTSGDITVGGDIDAADSKQANVYNLIVRNDGTVNGNLVIGSNTSDVVSFNSLVNTGIVPDGNTRTFGGAASRWATVYGIAGEYSGNVNIDGTLTADQKVTIGANTAQMVAINSQVETNLIPNSNNSSFRALGNTTQRWALLASTIGASKDITAAQDVDVTGEANTSTLRVRTTSVFEGDTLVGNSTVFVAVDEDEGDLDVTGWGNSTFQSKSSFWRNLVVGNNVSGNTTLTLTVGPAGQNLVNAQSNTWQDWGTVVLSSEATGGKIAAANAQLATLTVTDSVSLPSNTSLAFATANTNDLFVFNKAEFTGKANGENYVKFGSTTQKISLNLANAQFTTSIFSANTGQDIGSTSAKWGNAFLNDSIQVGTFLAQNTTNTGTGLRANTSALETNNIYARTDLVAKYRSDQRLKDDIIVIDTAINKVEAISGYEFTWNNKIGDYRSGRRDYGVLAQEIEQILPHAVEETDDGIKSVNYNSLIPLLVEAVKELSGRLKKLEGDAE